MKISRRAFKELVIKLDKIILREYIRHGPPVKLEVTLDWKGLIYKAEDFDVCLEATTGSRNCLHFKDGFIQPLN